MKRWVFSLAILFLGCSQKPPTQVTSTTTAVNETTVTSSATPVAASATPVQGEAFSAPALPEAAFEGLVEVRKFYPGDEARYAWWSEQGISENRLGIYASELEPAALQEKLLPHLSAEDHKPLAGATGWLERDGSQLGGFSQENSGFARFAVVSPIEPQPPAAWTALKIPEVEWAAAKSTLEGKKSLVVLATGYEMRYLVEGLLKNGSNPVSATPAPTDTPAATATATP